jgi:monoterpene epsilon-lactone hydrolase
LVYAKIKIKKMKSYYNLITAICVLVLFGACNSASEKPETPIEVVDTDVVTEEVEGERDIYIPTTISKEAQATLQKIVELKPYLRKTPELDEIDKWDAFYQGVEAQQSGNFDKIIAAYNVTTKEREYDGVPVLDVKPVDWKDNGKVLIYTHGGAYAIFSAKSTIASSAPMCNSSKLRVVSIDYTLVPHANWEQIQEQVLRVIKALLKEGYDMDDIAIYGDSAGGGLAISTVLNLRDAGLGMPAAVVLLSPWADISDAGDSQVTLKNADPTLSYDALLKNCAIGYASGLDLKDPKVSPLYADFTQGFPPCLIAEGTKCIFLSTSVRLYQALEQANQKVKLDMYEGMWHVFQQHPMPESKMSIDKATKFINKQLNSK